MNMNTLKRTTTRKSNTKGIEKNESTLKGSMRQLFIQYELDARHRHLHVVLRMNTLKGKMTVTTTEIGELSRCSDGDKKKMQLFGEREYVSTSHGIQ